MIQYSIYVHLRFSEQDNQYIKDSVYRKISTLKIQCTGKSVHLRFSVQENQYIKDSVYRKISTFKREISTHLEQLEVRKQTWSAAPNLKQENYVDFHLYYLITKKANKTIY